MRVSEGHTNLRRRKTLASKLADMLDELLRSSLEPCRRSTAIREGRGSYERAAELSSSLVEDQRLSLTNALSERVHAT